MKKCFKVTMMGAILLVFTLSLVSFASTQLVTDNFTVNTSNFSEDYQDTWFFQNCSKKDLWNGVINTSVKDGVLFITTTASKTPHIVNSYYPENFNYAVSAYVKPDETASAGVLARWIDKEYFYALRVRGEGTLDLSNSKVGGETLKSLNTDLPLTVEIPNFELGKWYKVTVVGTNEDKEVVIKGYVDDELLMTVNITDPALQLTEGQAGLYCTVKGVTACLKNFELSSL